MNTGRARLPPSRNSGGRALPDRDENRLNVGRGFTPRREKFRRRGIKPCPTKENRLNVGRGFTPRR